MERGTSQDKYERWTSILWVSRRRIFLSCQGRTQSEGDRTRVNDRSAEGGGGGGCHPDIRVHEKKEEYSDMCTTVCMNVTREVKMEWWLN